MAKVTSPEVRTRVEGQNDGEQFLSFVGYWQMSTLSFSDWDQLVQSVHGLQGCFHAPVSFYQSRFCSTSIFATILKPLLKQFVLKLYKLFAGK